MFQTLWDSEKEKLIQPNAIVSNIGTEIYYAPNWNIDEKWRRIISKNWAKERAASILDKFNLKLQPYKKDLRYHIILKMKLR